MGEPEFYKNKQASVPSSAKERAQVLSVNKKSLNRAVKKAYDLTNWNDHTGARRTMAKFFKYDDLVKRYDEVSKLHEEAGSLTSELRDVRDAIDETMDFRIRRDYGEDVLKQVYKGL